MTYRLKATAGFFNSGCMTPTVWSTCGCQSWEATVTSKTFRFNRSTMIGTIPFSSVGTAPPGRKSLCTSISSRARFTIGPTLPLTDLSKHQLMPHSWSRCGARTGSTPFLRRCMHVPEYRNLLSRLMLCADRCIADPVRCIGSSKPLRYGTVTPLPLQPQLARLQALTLTLRHFTARLGWPFA